MAHDPTALPPEVTEFLTERHLATLTTIRPDGTPHVVAVGFTWDAEAGARAGDHLGRKPQGPQPRRPARQPRRRLPGRGGGAAGSPSREPPS